MIEKTAVFARYLLQPNESSCQREQSIMCKPIGGRLFGILKVYAIVRTISKQSLESVEVVRCGDYENLTNTREHQHADRVIHHGFVINRHELLADAFRDGVQACNYHLLIRCLS